MDFDLSAFSREIMDALDFDLAPFCASSMEAISVSVVVPTGISRIASVCSSFFQSRRAPARDRVRCCRHAHPSARLAGNPQNLKRLLI